MSSSAQSADVSPTSTPCGTPLSGTTHAPKYGTVIPNRIFVGGIAANTTEAELKQFFTSYGPVKDSKIIADRAGVSKGYGFITFENQEDADRIIKRESDNLVFRERKLNIGPAIRKQQVLPRTFDTPVSPSTVMFSNGVPYTYQNGMAIFHSPEGGYQVPQPQPATAVMVPQTPTMYVQPQYTAYQTPPHWGTTAASAAAGQWRWTPQSPTMTAASPGYMFAAMQTSPELMYAQLPPHAYQPAELTDATMLEGPGVEGSLFPVDQNIQGNPTFVTDANGSLSLQQREQASPAVAAVYPVAPGVYSPVTATSSTVLTPATTVATVTGAPTSSTKATNATAVNVGVAAPYKKPLTNLPRRAYSSPTFLVKHGHKVQCVMMPPKSMPNGSVTIMSRPAEEEVGSVLLNRVTPPPAVTTAKY